MPENTLKTMFSMKIEWNSDSLLSSCGLKVILLKLSVHSPDSETVFVLGIGPFLVMLPLVKRYNGVLNGFKWAYKQNMSRKGLSDGIVANPRPL